MMPSKKEQTRPVMDTFSSVVRLVISFFIKGTFDGSRKARGMPCIRGCGSAGFGGDGFPDWEKEMILGAARVERMVGGVTGAIVSTWR